MSSRDIIRKRTKESLLLSLKFIAADDGYIEYDGDRRVYTVKTSCKYESASESILELADDVFLCEVAAYDGTITKKRDNITDEIVYETIFHRAYCLIVEKISIRDDINADLINGVVKELKEEILADQVVLEDVRNGILSTTRSNNVE